MADEVIAIHVSPSLHPCIETSKMDHLLGGQYTMKYCNLRDKHDNLVNSCSLVCMLKQALFNRAILRVLDGPLEKLLQLYFHSCIQYLT